MHCTARQAVLTMPQGHNHIPIMQRTRPQEWVLPPRWCNQSVATSRAQVTFCLIPKSLPKLSESHLSSAFSPSYPGTVRSIKVQTVFSLEGVKGHFKSTPEAHLKCTNWGRIKSFREHRGTFKDKTIFIYNLYYKTLSEIVVFYSIERTDFLYA